MLAMIMFCSAILCTTFVGAQADVWGPDAASIREQFGSMTRSMMTLFQFLTLADWAESTRMVASHNVPMAGFFVCYIILAAMVILSLLTGVLADHVNNVREQQDRDEKTEQDAQLSKALRTEYKLFMNADAGGRHWIDKAHFKEIWGKSSVQEELGKIGIDVGNFDPGDLFDSFDSRAQGKLTWQDFRAGMEEMRNGVVPKEIFKLEASLQRAIDMCGGKSRFQDSKVAKGLQGGADKEDALSEAVQTAGRLQGQLDDLNTKMLEYIERAQQLARDTGIVNDDMTDSDVGSQVGSQASQFE